MTQYNTLNVKLYNSQISKINLSSNAIDESNEQAIFPYKILLTNTQVQKNGEA